MATLNGSDKTLNWLRLMLSGGVCLAAVVLWANKQTSNVLQEVYASQKEADAQFIQLREQGLITQHKIQNIADDVSEIRKREAYVITRETVGAWIAIMRASNPDMVIPDFP